MRMMKNNNNETVMVIGIDHGYGNMKTATRCFPSGVARYDKEPIFQNNLLVYNGMYYQIGEEHKEFCVEKTQDEDYYVLTLAAIARELDGKGMNRAKVHIAAGLGHPNPHEDILKRYRELGGEIVTIGSDAHAPERIAADFDRACSILKKCGFRYHAIFRKRKPTFELLC